MTELNLLPTIANLRKALCRATVTGANCLTELLIQRRCCLCQQTCSLPICDQCEELLPWIGTACAACGTSLETIGICGQCQTNKQKVNFAAIPLQYSDPVSSMIHRFKYQQHLEYLPALTHLLAGHILKSNPIMPDVILPVPLHKNKLKQRGFNQAYLIARELGKLLQLPIDNTLIKRVVDTPSQTSLDQGSRRKNVANAFTVLEQERYHSVAIVDDVVTSGATIQAINQQLRNHGYHFVSVWAIAKT